MATVAKVEYRLDDGGSTKERLRDTEKLNRELNKTRGENQSYGQGRGSMGATGAAGRDFANQAQGLGGLVRLYATYAANVFAVTAAFNALSNAMNTSNMVKGLDQLGASSGQALGGLAKRFADVSGGAISLRESMEATAKASSSGLSQEQFLKLGEVAKKASQALGVNMSDAVSRLTRGITKLEPELLDELGIFTKVGKSTEDYAKSVGKSVSSLTDFERRQAFANAVLQEGSDKFSQININTNPYDKLLGTLRNVSQTILEVINKGLTPLVSLMSSSPTALLGIVGLFATKIVTQALPALTKYREGVQKDLIATSAAAKAKAKLARQSLLKDRELKAEQKQQRLDRIAEIKTQQVDAAQDALKLVSKRGLSKKVQGILAKPDILSITDQDLEVLNKLGNKTTKVSKQYKELAKSIHEAKNANNAYIAASAAAEAKAKAPPGYFSRAGQLSKQAIAARQSSIGKRFVSSVSSAYDIGGLSGGFDRLINTTDRLKPLSTLQRTFTLISGGATLLTRSILGLGSAFLGLVSGPLMAAFGIFTTLDMLFSTNGAAVDKLNQSFTGQSEAVKAATMTIERYSTEGLSVEKLSAYNTALGNVTTNIDEMVNSFQDVQNTSSIWDRLVDSVKGLFGYDFATQTGKKIKESMMSSLALIASPSVKKKAQEELKALFGGRDLSLIDPKEIAEKGSSIAKTLDTAKKSSQELLSPMIQAVDSTKALDQAYKDYTNSLTKATPLQIMLQKQLKAFEDIALAIKAGDENLAGLYNSLQKTGNLQYFSTSVQQAVQSLNSLAPMIAGQEAALSAEQAKVNGLKTALASLGDTVSKETRKVIETQLAEAEARVKNLTNNLSSFTQAKGVFTKTIQEGLVAASRAVVGEITSGINLAAQQSKISQQQSILSLFDKTPEAIKKAGELEQESIRIRIEEINSLNRLNNTMQAQQVSGAISSDKQLLDKTTPNTLEAAKLDQAIKNNENLLSVINAPTETARMAIVNALQASGQITQDITNFLTKQSDASKQTLVLQAQAGTIATRTSIEASRALSKIDQELANQVISIQNLQNTYEKGSLGFKQKSRTEQSNIQQSMAFETDYQATIAKATVISAELALAEKQKLTDEVKLKEQSLTALWKEFLLRTKINAQTEEQARIQIAIDNTNTAYLLAAQSASDILNVRLENEKQLSDYNQKALDLNLQTGKIGEDQYNTLKRILELRDIDLKKQQALQKLDAAKSIATEEFQKKLSDQNLAADDKQKIEAEQEAYNLLYKAQIGAILNTAELETKFLSMQKVLSTSTKAMADSIKSAFDSMGDALANFVETGKLDFKSLVNSILADIVRAQIKTQTAALGSSMMNLFVKFMTPDATPLATAAAASGIIGPNAKGNIYGIQKYAKGGMFTNSIVDSPTLFKFAKGTGLMGEAGPEAIMPLKRDSQGNLGVRGGGSNTEVVINNYSGEKATAQETVDSRGNRKVEVIIGEIAGSNVSTTGSSTQRSLANTYGLKPQVIRR